MQKRGLTMDSNNVEMAKPSVASKKVQESAEVVALKTVPDCTGSYVPEPDPTYEKYGNYSKVLKIIESRKFYPVWITGMAGNGKTQMVEQACAWAGLPKNWAELSNKREVLKQHKGREFIRVNFTMETDEDDLIGSLRLIEKNGTTITEFHEGPVITALRRGAILLLDEIDVGHTNKIMCLQSVLEGRGVLIKTTGEFVKPTPGFQIFATSNTKGRGCADGRFVGTNIMNGAFLDRFAATIHQTYPPFQIEEKIIKKSFMKFHWADRKSENEITSQEMMDAGIISEKLCRWAEHVRIQYDNSAFDEVISTRTLINIIQGYSIFGNPKDAIKLACERFDADIAKGLMSFFEKLNPEIILMDDEEGSKPAKK